MLCDYLYFITLYYLITAQILKFEEIQGSARSITITTRKKTLNISFISLVLKSLVMKQLIQQNK